MHLGAGGVRRGRAALAGALWLNGLTLSGGEVEGTVIVTRRLTKPRVTATADAYSRGLSVELATAAALDWQAYERSHVVVYLEGKLPPRARPFTAVIEQKGRRFIPDLVVIPAGSSVSFPNLDPIFHNVFSLSKARSFDLGNYPRDQTRVVDFPKPGVVVVGCHLHPNMSAIVFVSPNAWATTADSQGRFRLSDVPPGEYTVVAWHKAAGFFRRNVPVPAEGVVQVEFLIPISDDNHGKSANGGSRKP